MCLQALEAVREALDAREDAVCRREEQLALRASEMRDAESTMQQLDVRRHQAQQAIAKLSDIQRQQDATLAQTHARLREVQMCQCQVEEREQRLEEREEQLAHAQVLVSRRQQELSEEEARIHQLRAAADVASIKDKQVASFFLPPSGCFDLLASVSLPTKPSLATVYIMPCLSSTTVCSGSLGRRLQPCLLMRQRSPVSS